MANVKKSQVNAVSRQLVAKAQSWNQVAKQLSGMSGKITLDNSTITVHEAFKLLGVQTEKNRYTAKDFAAAWAKELMSECELHRGNDWRAPMLCKPVAMVVDVDGKDYRLYTLTDGEYKAVRVQKLCKIVKAEDRGKNSTAVVVSVQNVLRGLTQSVFIEDTLKGLENSRKEAEKLTTGWVNTGTTTVPKWVKVEKKESIYWCKAEEKVVDVKVEPEQVKPEQKPKNTRKNSGKNTRKSTQKAA